MKDEIVDEIHKVREELAKRFDYDVRKMLEYIRKKQNKSGRTVISLEKSKSSGIRRVKKVA